MFNWFLSLNTLEDVSMRNRKFTYRRFIFIIAKHIALVVLFAGLIGCSQSAIQSAIYEYATGMSPSASVRIVNAESKGVLGRTEKWCQFTISSKDLELLLRSETYEKGPVNEQCFKDLTSPKWWNIALSSSNLVQYDCRPVDSRKPSFPPHRYIIFDDNKLKNITVDVLALFVDYD